MFPPPRPDYQILYSRKDQNGCTHHNFVGNPRYEKTDGSIVSLNRFWRTNFCAFSPGPPWKKLWGQKMSKSDLTDHNLYSRKGSPGSLWQNSTEKLSFEKTDSSSVFLNRFWRTVFAHLPITPLKKFWGRKIFKISLGNQNQYSRKE